MLDTTTKRRIDDARDILVGKVPDPKSQVEQITIALIYKFMDDMDKESVEFGGKPTFFTGDYEKYSWTKIFDPKLGGYDMLNLYSEAIDKLNHNPNIPQLFRDIFKNAYLPYRDPETLKLFLKTINEFHYDHSEKLGDAFEYLLSVLGSQGDAGQFRTPRHIIDFIVEIMQPKKNETIADIACGTAGFLISAYKYILTENTKKKKGDLLTPDDRKKLIQNFTGYDISPDMVRLSLVNMYLHGFSTPHIYEYDTLTSEDRWGDYFDLILANPPFMSPKGGIKPHKKFTMQSNRSEVLFTDYIAEHINPVSGRAAVIVPEGIIFQSGTAYKSLRKLLVDKEYLYAVVSLPAGVFQPYSGVKTSILLMDKVVAKRTDNILFLKIEADGFDLGAQRRSIEKNDLPAALETIIKYKEAVLTGEDYLPTQENALLVPKGRIKMNDDYNLSADRYKVSTQLQSAWQLVRLGDVCDFSGGTQPPKETFISEPREGYIRLLQIRDYKSDKDAVYIPIVEKHKTCTKSDIMIGRYGPPVFQILRGKEGAYNVALIKCIPDLNKITEDWLFYFLSSDSIQERVISLSERVRQSGVRPDDLRELLIPLPPISLQKDTATKIEGYQRIIDGARQVVEAYKPQIDIDPSWESVELGEVCEINPKKSELRLLNDTYVSFVPMADINENNPDFEPLQERKLRDVFEGYTYFRENDVLLAKVTPCFENGKAGIAKNLTNEIGFGSSEFYVLRCRENVLPLWIYLQVTSRDFNSLGKSTMTGTGGLQRVPKDFIQKYLIPLPSIEKQKEILEKIRQEQEIVNSNKLLIQIFEQKIKDEINKLWQTADNISVVEKQKQALTVSI